MSDNASARLRVAIIGSCQVVGLAAAARQLLPGAEVRAWHVGVFPKDTDEELLDQLSNFDTVISQISDQNDHIALGISRLRERGLPVTFLPVLAFPGFHPDITYIRRPTGLLPGQGTDYHSVIVATAFALGLPATRVPALFNALVFTELGFFSVFDAATTALFAIFDKEGYEIRAMMDGWMRRVGQFMYTINHPHIVALEDLCRAALVRAGRLDPATPPAANVDDYLATHFIWPVYPALAKRLGLTGSTTFQINSFGLTDGQTRDLPLTDYVAACYRSYDSLGKDALQAGGIAIARERLASLVIA